MRAIIIEDDHTYAHLLHELSNRNKYLEILRTFESAATAIEFLKDESVDLIFLDIGLPDSVGLELIKQIDKKTQVIIITSDAKYAVEAFDYRAVDYLLKPVSPERFNEAVLKAKHNYEVKFSSLFNKEHLFIKENSQYHNVNAAEVLYIEALGDYVSIVSKNRKFTILSTMRDIEQKLPESMFIRVHRSYIANIDKIETYDGNMLTIDKRTLSVGKTYKRYINSRLNII